MFTLIAMGTGVAWLYSIIGTVLPGVFPPVMRAMDGAVAVYFEAAAVITVLVLLGQVLELRARERTSGAIRALLDLSPKTARRIRADGSDEDVTLDLVAVGDRLRVRPGERVPVDGTVVSGRSGVDQSLVTGEAVPAEKTEGDAVIGGSINGTGTLLVKITAVGEGSFLHQVIRHVEDARAHNKAARLVHGAADDLVVYRFSNRQ